MAKIIPTYYLHGVEAIPVDVIADKDRAAVVKHGSQRVLYSVRLESSGSGAAVRAGRRRVLASPR